MSSVDAAELSAMHAEVRRPQLERDNREHYDDEQDDERRGPIPSRFIMFRFGRHSLLATLVHRWCIRWASLIAISCIDFLTNAADRQPLRGHEHYFACDVHSHRTTVGMVGPDRRTVAAKPGDKAIKVAAVAFARATAIGRDLRQHL